MKDDSENRISRREMLCRAACGGGLFLLLPVLPAFGAPTPGAWVAVGKSSAFPVGVPKRVDLPGGGAAHVTRRKDGTFLALSAVCTHAGCLVRWDNAGSRYVCPCHGAQFGAAGGNLRGPARRPLAVLRTRLQGGAVQILAAASARAGGGAAGRSNGGEDEDEDKGADGGGSERRREHDDEAGNDDD